MGMRVSYSGWIRYFPSWRITPSFPFRFTAAMPSWKDTTLSYRRGMTTFRLESTKPHLPSSSHWASPSLYPHTVAPAGTAAAADRSSGPAPSARASSTAAARAPLLRLMPVLPFPVCRIGTAHT